MTSFDHVTKRYFALLESLQQAVITTDRNGSIIHWSKQAEKVYGWPASEVTGKNILEVTPSDLTRAQGAQILEALGRGEVWSGQFGARGRDEKTFKTSVTDVPLLNDAGAVIGIIAVSALAESPTILNPLLTRFAAACEEVWPGGIVFGVSTSVDAAVPAAEPHIIQLLSLLVLLFADLLDERGLVEVVMGVAEQSLFADFDMASSTPGVYIRIGKREEQSGYSVLRSLSTASEPTRFASALVRMVGGKLIASGGPAHLKAVHLFLPVEKIA